MSEADIIPDIHSHHSLLKLEFSNNTNNNIGKGLWKFNSSLLHDHTYVQNIKSIILESSIKYKYLEDKAMVWELVKLDIRTFTLPYTIKKKNEQKILETNLNKRYLELHNIVQSNTASDLEKEEYDTVKNEIEIIECHKARGAIIRSKCKWTEEGNT